MLRVTGPSVWRAQDLGDETKRHAPFSSAEMEALQAASERYTRIRRDLEMGPGFVRISGVPVDGQDEERLESFFLAFARHVGTPVSQTTRGDRIFRVADAGLGEGDSRARGPNSRKALTFHSDRCDVIGFLCVRPSAKGGESIVVSAGAIHNRILETRPELLKTLYEPFYWKRHNIDTANPQPWYRMPIFAQERGAFAVTLMQVLIDRAHGMPELPDLTDEQAEALALIQTLAADPEFQLRFRQEPGEILLLNNYVTLHSRTEFTDEPGTPGRLLLRAWISVPDSRPLPASWAAHYGVVAAGAVRGGIRVE